MFKLRSVAFAASSFVLLLTAAAAAAQDLGCPPPLRYIPRASLSATPTTYTIEWDPVGGGGAYAVWQAVTPNYCSGGNPSWSIVGTTTGTRFTAPKPIVNAVYIVMVTLASDRCVGTRSVYSSDTFTTPPTKPFIDSIGMVNGHPRVTTSYRDPHVLGTFVERACGNGPFAILGFIYTCAFGAKSFTDNPATNFDRAPPLTEGTHRYRLHTQNSGTGQHVYSDPVSITIGTPVRIKSFAAAPATILRGQETSLSWETSGVVTIDRGIGSQPNSGTVRVSPVRTTEYTLTVTRGCDSLTAKTAVNVVGITSFKATPPAINAGQTTTLSWSTEGAEAITIQPRLGARPPSGSAVVAPQETTTYTLTATSGGVSAVERVNVLVLNLPNVFFEAAPPAIREGETAKLLWRAEGATEVKIDNGIGPRRAVCDPKLCSEPVTPAKTTTYYLTAMSPGGNVTTSTTVEVIPSARVRVSRFAGPMAQPPGKAVAATSYVLTNSGGATTTVRLGQDGNFFSQSPPSFALAPGASQVVDVRALAQAPGPFQGFSIPTGEGVPAGLQIAIRLLSILPPNGFTLVRPVASRVDLSGAGGTVSKGAVAFTNSGNATLTGMLTTDSPWLAAESPIITIPPGATASASVLVDRTKRPDAAGPLGTTAAKLTLSYLGESMSTAVSSASVLDTIQLPVTQAGPAPLNDGELALFVPGVGHVNGSVGLFLSDVSLFNPFRSAPVDDLRLFYTPAGSSVSASKSVSLPSLADSVLIADPVRNVFGVEGQVGSLQIRSKQTARMAVSTTIFNASNSRGTYGTTIPTFRSDRSAAAGEVVVLAGLRHDATSHTNLFIQETDGLGVTVSTEFLAADGRTVGTRRDTVGPFGLAQINDAVPAGAVAAILTNVQSSGAFHSYATPVDEASGDNWSVVDWGRQYGYSAGDARVVPVAGAVHGANGTYFRTEVAILNSGATAASGTLRFISRSGEAIDRPIVLEARQSVVVEDVVGTLFGVAGDAVGHLVFTPLAGSFAMTSRTYTTVSGQPATFGTGVPALPLSAALEDGTMQTIAGLEDAALATVMAAVPATFRTNFGLLETSGQPARVLVTLRFDGMNASKEYDLAPNQFLLFPGLAAEILGDARSLFGDLRNVALDVQVTAGAGRVVVFTSSVDNGSGDSILRTE